MYQTLVYASRARPETTLDDVMEICRVSRRNNSAAGITGALFYNGRAFFQVLEGDAVALRKLFDAISADHRHTDVALLALNTVRNRLFRTWSMKYVDGRIWTNRRFPPGVTPEMLSDGGEIVTLARILELRAA